MDGRQAWQDVAGSMHVHPLKPETSEGDGRVESVCVLERESVRGSALEGYSVC